MTPIICQSCGGRLPAGFKFCGLCGQLLDAPAGTDPAAASPAAASDAPRDEFRDVTVLFGDVSGFTAMSERLDPETVHQIMNDCFEGLGRIIQEQGGHIDKYIGDSIMAVFGAPIAHDDDPVRAGEAGLAMQAFLHDFARSRSARAGIAFKMRIGIHCGLVLAGAVGAQVRRDYSVVGDTVNTASRLEGAARPGTILVSAEFSRRVAGRFRFRFGPASQLTLKGKERHIEALELLGNANEADARQSVGNHVPLVGRDDEIASLTRCWTDKAGRCRWIEVRGPLGIGKTRLVESAGATTPGVRLLKVVARPTTKNRPYALARRILHALLQEIGRGSELQADRDSFFAALAPVSFDLQPYFNALWYLAAPDALAVKSPDPDPMTFRRTVDRGLATLFANVAAWDGDLVLFLDAYDEADDATRELFRVNIGSRTRPAPRIVTTVRADTPPDPQATTVIDLPGLPSAASSELLDRLVHAAELPAQLRTDLLARTEGIPLYLEELVQKLIDEGELGPGEIGGPWRCNPQAGSASLPGSLLGAMISKLDRLDARRRDLLCQCAVQGVEFDTATAASVWRTRGGSHQVFETNLRDLERWRLVSRSPSDANRWSFSQVIMQNACYDSMLRRDRKSLHADVANALSGSRGRSSASPEILAHHYELSEQWPAAARMNLEAGHRAAALFSNADALKRFDRAIAAVGAIEATTEDDTDTVVAAHRGAGLVHLRIGNYQELERHALAMLRATERGAAIAEAHRLLAASRMHQGDLQQAEQHLLDALALLGEQAESATEIEAEVDYDLADLHHRTGRNEKAKALIARCRPLVMRLPAKALCLDLLDGRVAHTEGRFNDAVALYRRAQTAATELGSLSEQALSSNNMGNASRDVGQYDEANRYFERALEIWMRTGDTENTAGAHNNLANLAISRGDVETAQDHYQQALAAFQQIGNAAGTALAQTNLAVLSIETRDYGGAVALAQQARDNVRHTGHRVLLGLTTVILGEALVETGTLGEAEREFRWVLTEFDDTQHPLAIAGAMRGLGRVALARHDGRTACDCLEQARALYERLAREQEAARTQVFLARARHLDGQAEAARKELEEACARFCKIGAANDLARAERLSFAEPDA